jgi:lysophospholipase L1-like esterase
MASKDVLKHGKSYVPTINDDASSQFGAYETYSRDKIDDLVKNTGNSGVTATGYDWSGKKIVYEGESITMNNTMAYPEYVAEQTGCNSVKIGIAGVPIMGDYVGKAWDFRRRISNIPADADAIIVLGDCNAITSSDSQQNSTAIADWGGRWNLAVDAIKRSFPTVPLFLVSEYPMKGKPNQNKNTPIQFEAMARKHGAIFVCLATESPLSLIYGYPKYGLTATDGVHTNHEGMKLFADAIIRRLKQVPPPDWTGTDSITIDATATVAVGATASIGCTVTGDLSVQWTSDNMDVACVMGGTVYGMATGTATITAKTRSGKIATCTVTVTE